MRSAYRNKKQGVAALAAMLLAALAVGCNGESSAKPARARVRIGEQVWSVEVMLTRRQHEQGMMGRTRIPEDEGMLFVFPEVQERVFYMKNCLVPIDLLFISPARRVVRTHEMKVEPGMAGEMRYPSDVPVQYALEIAGGSIERLGIEVGDEVEFINVPSPPEAEAEDRP
jgi:hypothetical protein